MKMAEAIRQAGRVKRDSVRPRETKPQRRDDRRASVRGLLCAHRVSAVYSPRPELAWADEISRRTGAIHWLAVIFSCVIAGCSFAPKYSRPSAEAPAEFKELTTNNFKETDGWKTAEPRDDAIRGQWWEVFNDSRLNALEDKIEPSNQSVAAALANLLAARAMVKEARADLFPTLTANPSVSRSYSSTSRNQSS